MCLPSEGFINKTDAADLSYLEDMLEYTNDEILYVTSLLEDEPYMETLEWTKYLTKVKHTLRTIKERIAYLTEDDPFAFIMLSDETKDLIALP